MITAVGVVVPAHNEAGRVGACLESIKVALAALPSNVDSAIWVMVDRSLTGRFELLRRRWPGARAGGGKAPGKSAPLDGSGIEEPAQSSICYVRTQREIPGFSIPTPTARCRVTGLYAICAMLRTERTPLPASSASTTSGTSTPGQPIDTRCW